MTVPSLASGLARAGFIVLACAAPRFAYLWITGPDDPAVYPWLLSEGLLRSGTMLYDGVPTGAFEPFHPFLIAVARRVTGDHLGVILSLQIGLGCAAAVMLDRLTRQMTGSSSAGLVAAGAYAGSPYLIRHASSWMEITLLTMLMCAGWLAWARARPVLAVVCLSLAALTRTIVWPIALVAVVLALRRDRRRGLLAGLMMLVVMGPWAVRNTVVAGTPWPSRHGRILYDGNNPLTASLVPWHDMDLFKLQPVPPVPDDDYSRAVLHYVRAHPAHALWTKLRNAAYFFSPRLIPYFPVGDDSELRVRPDGRVETLRPRLRPPVHVAIQEGAAALLLVAGGVGWWRRRARWREDALLLASVAVVTAVAALYYPTTRLRTAIDPVFMAYAGSAFVERRRQRYDAGPGRT